MPYLLASQRNGTLYVGITNDLSRRIYEHKAKPTIGLTSRYDVDRLVWSEAYDQIDEAIAREKALKKWRRAWKLTRIEETNPTWRDLDEMLNQ